MKNIYLVTGACQEDEELNFQLTQFLDNGNCNIVLWIDFKSQSSYLRSLESLKKINCSNNIKLINAPSALWGGFSILETLIHGLFYCSNNYRDFTNILILSIRDLPLINRHGFDMILENFSTYDFCGSFWNSGKYDFVKESQVDFSKIEGGKYNKYTYRSGVNFLVHESLSATYTESLIKSGRISDNLSDRVYCNAIEMGSINTICINPLNEISHLNRVRFIEEFGLYYGRMWIYINQNMLKLLLDNKNIIYMYQFFYSTLNSDEGYFQTVAKLYSNFLKIWPHNFYYDDADVKLVTNENFSHFKSTRKTYDILIRKSHSDFNFLENIY